MKDRPVSWAVLSGLAVGMGALIGISGLSLRSAAEQRRAAESVAHTHIVRQTLSDLRSAVVEAQSSRRGYVITGDEQFRSSFERAVSRLGQSLSTLRSLTADNTVQQARILDITPRLDRLGVNLRSSIDS